MRDEELGMFKGYSALEVIETAFHRMLFTFLLHGEGLCVSVNVGVVWYVIDEA